MAMLLVEAHGSGFKVHDEAVKVLSAIKNPIAVVAIAGRYRCGKSFLINQLLEKPGAFNVGDTTNACTKVSTVARRCGCSALCCCLLPSWLGLSARCTGSPSVNSPTSARTTSRKAFCPAYDYA